MDEKILEQYKKTEALLNPVTTPPTEEKIQETISIIKERLEYKPINRHINAAVKEGYQKAVEILEARQSDFNKVDVSGLKTTQGRAIAAIACDYLNGECSATTLCGVPVKDK